VERDEPKELVLSVTAQAVSGSSADEPRHLRQEQPARQIEVVLQ
jgi:hypothetical protein